MKWSIPKSLSPAETKIVKRLKRRSQFFVFLREIRHELFDAEFQAELASAYAPRGQAPVPPALLAMVTLLQAYTGASDAEAVEAATMDRRWQLVLGSLDMDEAPFGQGTLVRFRARLISSDLDQRLLERTVEFAKKTGKFGWQRLRVALDSSPLRGAGRVEDAWNLIGHSMRQLIYELARLSGQEKTTIIEESGAYVVAGTSLKATLDIDWDDAGARSKALATVVGQARALVAWGRQNLPEIMENATIADAVELLEKVIDHNTEPDPDSPNGHVVKSGVPPDRICSIGDPEMRHGRKSRSKAFNGYKRHVATHVDVPLVLAARALPANQSENKAVPLLLDDIAEHGELVELFIDRGYVSHERVAQLDSAGVPVRCRPWPENNLTGLFSKKEFQIDLDGRHVTCPAGKTVSFSLKDGRAQFGAKRCAPCPKREKCTTAKHGRTLVVHPQEQLLRKLREGIQTDAGRQLLRRRVSVEHRLARIGGRQGQQARYKGQRKNTFDLRRNAAVTNLMEVRHAAAA